MKRAIVTSVLVAITFIAAKAQDLKYVLRFDGGRNCVHVKLTYTPKSEGTVTFIYGEPMFGGQEDIINCLQNVRVKGAKEYHIDRVKRTIAIKGKAAGKNVAIRYDVFGCTDGSDDFKQELFRPLFSKDYFYTHGLNLFLRPSEWSLMQSYTWRKKPPFNVVNVLKPDATIDEEVTCHPYQIGMSLIVGTPTMKVQKEQFQQVDGYLLTDLTDGQLFNQTIISTFFRRYMSQLRTFWGDEDVKESYVFCVLPFSKTITHSAGGISLTGGFCSKYRQVGERDTILTPNMRFNVAHEMGHKWLGGTLSLGTDQQWFHEGFNDYQTFVNLVSSGLMSKEDFAQEWSRLLDRYYGSPVHTLPNDSIIKHYWEMGDYNRLPYWRGCIFAAYLDQTIRKHSNGRQSWQDLMRALRKEANKRGAFSIEIFENVLQTYLPTEMSAHELVEKHIIRGEDIDRHEGVAK